MLSLVNPKIAKSSRVFELEQVKRPLFFECLGQKLEFSLTRGVVKAGAFAYAGLEHRDHSSVHIDRLTVNEV